MKLRHGDEVDITFDRLEWKQGQDMKGDPETQTFEVFRAEIIDGEIYVELRRNHEREKQILNIKLNLKSRVKILAFAKGLHPRLGGDSPLNYLNIDVDVLKK